MPPLSKNQFRAKILKKPDAETCDLRKARPPIGPKGCIIRTLQKADGKYHHFRKDGSDYVQKNVEYIRKEMPDHDKTVRVRGAFDVDGKIVASAILPFQQSHSIQRIYFRIKKQDGTYLELSKKGDTGARQSGLHLRQSEWEQLDRAPAWNDMRDYVLDHPLRDRDLYIGYYEAGGLNPTNNQRSVYYNFYTEVDVKSKGEWRTIKKFPVTIGPNTASHSNVVGMFGLKKLGKYNVMY